MKPIPKSLHSLLYVLLVVTIMLSTKVSYMVGITPVQPEFNFDFIIFPANLTGHVERVGIENFELLKVLGTGGEFQHVLYSLSL